MKHIGTVAALVALSVLAAGCGGSEHKQLSKADFVTRSDAFCTKGNQMRKRAGSEPKFDPSKATPAQVKSSARYLGQDLAATRYEISHVRGLGLPQQEGDTVRKLLDQLSKDLVPAESRLVDAAKQGDVKRFKAAIASLNESGPKLEPLERKIGFKVCGR